MAKGLSRSDKSDGYVAGWAAATRLRSVLAAARDGVPGDRLPAVISELDWLVGLLTPTREWVSCLGDGLAAAEAAHAGDEDLARLRVAAEARCSRARETAAESLKGERMRGLLASLVACPDDPSMAMADGTSAGDEKQAAHALDRQTRRVLRCGRPMPSLTDEEWRRLNVEVRTLHHLTSAFGSLFPAKRVADYEECLGRVEPALDAWFAMDLARRLGDEAASTARGRNVVRLHVAAGVVVGRARKGFEDQRPVLSKAWTKLAAQAPFWVT